MKDYLELYRLWCIELDCQRGCDAIAVAAMDAIGD